LYAAAVAIAAIVSFSVPYWLLVAVSALMFFLSFLPAKNEPGADAGEVPMHREAVMAKKHESKWNIEDLATQRYMTRFGILKRT
jgi:hypothetical protein